MEVIIGGVYLSGADCLGVASINSMVRVQSFKHETNSELWVRYKYLSGGKGYGLLSQREFCQFFVPASSLMKELV